MHPATVTVAVLASLAAASTGASALYNAGPCDEDPPLDDPFDHDCLTDDYGGIYQSLRNTAVGGVCVTRDNLASDALNGPNTDPCDLPPHHGEDWHQHFARHCEDTVAQTGKTLNCPTAAELYAWIQS